MNSSNLMVGFVLFSFSLSWPLLYSVNFQKNAVFLSIRAITAVYFLHCINTWSVWERATELALAEANCHGSWVRAILSITRQELCSRDDALKTAPLSLLVWCSNFIEGIWFTVVNLSRAGNQGHAKFSMNW